MFVALSRFVASVRSIRPISAVFCVGPFVAGVLVIPDGDVPLGTPMRNEMAARLAREEQMNVLIVCDNDETLLGLRGYLIGAGVNAHATRRLSDAWGQSGTVEAMVLFPDDFDPQEVSDGLTRSLQKFPRTLAVVVTGDPQRFNSLVAGFRSSVVMAKPAWSWTILDVLRANWLE